MNERNSSSLRFAGQKSLNFLFAATTTLFILSWFFILLSASETHFFASNLASEFRPLAQIINDSTGQHNSTPSVGNRSILGDSKEQKIAEEEERRDELMIHKKEECTCEKRKVPVPLKVYMYDMDPEFHFGLLDWKPEENTIWPDIRTDIPRYPGGLNLQHSIEYWLTLDLLLSEHPNPSNSPRAAIRVCNSTDADVIFVPFFSSLSYNQHSKLSPKQKKSRNKQLQEKLVKFVTSQKEWKISGGRDHVILAHHPNSMLSARTKLFRGIFILSDFGRYPPRIANADKDVIAPYKHVVRSYVNDTSSFESRPTLMYFQGAIYRKDGGFVRQELYYLLKDEKDVHFSFGSVKNDGVHKAGCGMQSSKFCLNIAGDTPSSNRLFDAIASHCVPVIISDEIELPYEDVLDYSLFCIFVRTSDALKKDFLVNLLRSVKRDEWTRMWTRLKEIQGYFEFGFPSKEDDAVQMIWKAVARKVPLVKRKIHKSWRYSRSIQSRL